MTQTIEPKADNIYLGGDFAPVDSEVLATDLEVIGAVPPELEGRYIRNGPNPIGDVDPASHWFSGPGMVHGVRLRGGGAEWYRNRWVAGKAVTDALGRPEVPGPPRHAESSPNTNVSGFAGTTWALVEGGSPPAELDYDLATIRRNDFFGTLPNGFSAHPKVDPATGDMHAMCHSWGELADHIEYVVIGSEGRVKHIAEVPLPGMSMVDDMSITESFPFRWNPGYGARIGLMPLGGAAEAIIWCDVSLCYVYHVLNAYDAPDGTVVIDVCRYDKMFDRDVYGPAGDCLPTLDRWTVDPKRRTVREERIDDRFHEFPRVRDDRTGRFHRFGYTAAVGEHFAPGSTYKHDLATGTLTEHDHGPGRGTAEPAFVARPGGTDEDDGWLLSYVSDRAAGRSELVILDARDMTEQPVARVLLPARVPAGFHGNWIPDTGVSSKLEARTMSNERTEAHADLVLVTGATGRQGGAVAHQLLKAGIPVRALTRSPGSESARQLAAAGAEIVTGDMSVADTLDAALDGVATVFSVQDFYAKDAGYDGEVAQGTNLARAAKCAGVAHYVQSTMAATSDPGDVDHFRSKFAIERIVESFDLPYTFVGTVWFMDNVSDPKNGGKLTFPALNGTLAPAAKFHMLCIEDLGAAVSRIIIERDRHLGRRIDLAGDVLTLPELKASYTEASGRHPKRWAIPNLMLRMFARDFAAQLRWHNRVGWSFGTDGLRGLVPDATDFGHYVARHEVANL